MPGQLLKLFGTTTILTYAQNVALIPNLLAYWKLDETSGTTATDASGNGYNGTYSGPTLNSIAGPSAGMGNAPSFDGINDKMTPATLTGFTPGEGSWGAWCKVSGAGIWTDGASRPAGWFGVNTNNRYTMTKHTVANQFRYVSLVGGTTTAYNYTTAAPTGWFHVALTWKSTGSIVSYFNGTQVDSQAYAGTWSGSTYTGEVGTLSSSGVWWSGYLAHVAIYTRQLTAGEITTLATAV